MKHKKSIPPVTYTVDLHGISVAVTKKRMKAMRLRVRTSDRTVHLSVPTSVPHERAMLFLSSKEDWIREVLAMLPKDAPTEARRGESGESFTLWGERYTLSVTEGTRYSLSLSDSDRIAHLSAPKSSTPESRAMYLNEYARAQLLDLLSTVIPRWESVTGLTSASHDVRLMKSRWGSCNVRTRHIRLSLRLTEHPQICTEYVVLHELCHLKIPHHGKDFHALVGSFMPERKAIRALLNGKG